MQRCEAVQCVAPTPQQAAFDGLVNAFNCELERYENNLRRLLGTLEAPRPTNIETEAKQCIPQTVQDAFQDMYIRLEDANKSLYHIIDRLQEQVGELKILP